MALFSYVNRSPEAGLKDVYLEFAVGAIGAVGAFARRQGFTNGSPAAAVRTGAGAYTLNLDQRWQALVDDSIRVAGTIVGATDGYVGNVLAASLNQAQPTVTIVLRRADGTAADPPNGSVLKVRLTLKDSTV